MNLPKARTSDLLEMEAGNELLIYDLRINKAYNLNETSKIVYRYCDGRTTLDELKRRYKFSDDLIYFALDELNTSDLLENYASDYFNGLSRREVIKKVGLASVIALPVIAGLVAPPAARAASGSTCSNQPSGVDAGNGSLVRGETCRCRVIVNGQFAPCNTTRGGIPDRFFGCQPGCLCQYSGTAAQCTDGNGSGCIGTCG